MIVVLEALGERHHKKVQLIENECSVPGFRGHSASNVLVVDLCPFFLRYRRGCFTETHLWILTGLYYCVASSRFWGTSNIAFCGEECGWDVVILSFILPLYIDLGQLRVPESAVPIPVHSETRTYLLCYLFWSYHPAEAFIAG